MDRQYGNPSEYQQVEYAPQQMMVSGRSCVPWKAWGVTGQMSRPAASEGDAWERESRSLASIDARGPPIHHYDYSTAWRQDSRWWAPRS